MRNNLERLNYWWSEGFTDYYSRVLALRSSVIITLEEFVEEFNKFFENYYLSPVINEPNNVIATDYWQDYAVRLPYYSGFVLALYLDNFIKENNKSKSLDNVMLDLFKTSKEQECSSDYFKTIVKIMF
ncbi:M61 family metallopeptidase [Rickettsia rickettsii]|uniref:M61 family metallopeptidase n=1 Tax=Rickettsia rickettsii TaxID=783 RepID=UPI001E4556FB|nr:peptidase [Rickettsia rickettsii]